MKLRTTVRTNVTVRTRTQTVLLYSAVAFGLAGIIAGLFFIYFQFGPENRSYASGLPGFEFRQEITIQPGFVAGGTELHQFPVLINTTSSDLRFTAYGGKVADEAGGDIRFTISGSHTLLKHQVVEYNPRDGRLTAWVQVPVLSPSEPTILHLYFGNSSSLPLSTVAEVWSEGFAGVWGMESLSGPAIQTNGATQTTGKVGEAASFDGAGNYIRIPHSTALDLTTEGTIEAWIRPASFSNHAGIVHKGDLSSTADQAYYLQLGGPGLGNSQNDQLVFGLRHASGERFVVSQQHLQANEWYHVAAVWDSDSLRLYINGVRDVAAPCPYPARTTLGGLNIGTAFFGQPGRYPFHGLIDEVRTSPTARSEGWIATGYGNANNPSGGIGFSPTLQLMSGGSGSTGCESGADTLADFGHRFHITLDEAMVSGNSSLYNVPVLIDVTDTALRPQNQGGLLLSPQGNDIRFTAGDGTTLLNFQVEQYIPGLGRLLAWVQVSELKANEDTELFLYVQNQNLINTPGSSTATWPSPYMAVWHLNESPGGAPTAMTDYTGNGKTATTQGGMNTNSTISGKIGNGLTFNGSNQYLRVEPHSSLNLVNNGDYSLTAWVRTNSSPGNFRGIFHQENGSGTGRMILGLEPGNNSTCNAANTYYSNVGNQATCSGQTYNGAWQHLAITVRENGSTDTVRIYVNGVLAETTVRNSETNNNARWRLGGALQVNRHWTGDLDELRFLNVLLSPDRIMTEYRNANAPGQYTTLFCPQQINVPGFWLPVELAYFDAELQPDETVLLEWATFQETDNDYFTVERSTDGQRFEVVGTKDGAGNAHQKTTYLYTDESPYSGTSYYRLKQTDLSGSYTYLPIRKVHLEAQSSSLEIVAVFPNPFNREVSVEFEAEENGAGLAVLSNMSGRQVYQQQIQAIQGRNRVVLEPGNIAPGTYILQLTLGNSRTEYKLIKGQ